MESGLNITLHVVGLISDLLLFDHNSISSRQYFISNADNIQQQIDCYITNIPTSESTNSLKIPRHDVASKTMNLARK